VKHPEIEEMGWFIGNNSGFVEIPLQQAYLEKIMAPS
jgi:hypothetical protein